jgi:hypothetical protein
MKIEFAVMGFKRLKNLFRAVQRDFDNNLQCTEQDAYAAGDAKNI